MALIIYKENGVGYDVSLPLKEPLLRAAIAQIVSIRADGEELTHIKELFDHSHIGTPVHARVYNIPMKYDAPHMIWWGDIARTILSNL